MITNLKEFEKFLKICQKQGVSEASVNGITVKIQDKPKRSRVTAKKQSEDEIETDGLSPDELLFYHLQHPGANQ